MFLFRSLAAFLLLFHGVVQPASLSDAGGGNNRIFQGQKLSEKEHDDDENFEYDHEAFLGADEAHEFDDLDPEESKRRLGVIVDKIDDDSDGFLTLDEMRKWIRFTQDRYMTQDVETQWAQHNQDGKEEIGWEEYRKLVYGFTEDDPEDGGDQAPSYRQMEDRDRRRWNMADEDDNGALSKLEFKHFLHPEEVERMRDVVVQETMEDIDKDGDGQLSVDEYIGDMYQGEEDEQPDWVWRERENFNELRDQDGDGQMNEQEVRDWILPRDFDHVEAEARHLMTESDSDDDGKLTKEEILDKYDLFVGSQVTDFGEALSRHDEF